MKKLSQEEAAKVLEDMKVKIEIPKAAVTQWKRNTALDMAIEALNRSENPNNSDCISRQDAIDICDHAIDLFKGQFGAGVLVAIKESIEELPPVQFATDTNVGTKLGTNLAQLGTDCISRQTVLDALDEISNEVADGYGFDYAKWREYFCELPPAELKRGKWIQDRSGAYCCSECMEPCAGYVMMKPRDKFCKMCGAKMEVTE